MTRFAALPLAVLLLAGCASRATGVGSGRSPATVVGPAGVTTISVSTASVVPATTGGVTDSGVRPFPVPVTPPPHLDARTTLTIAANGGSVSAQVGDVLTVHLERPNTFQDWDRLEIAHGDVLTVRTTSGGYPGTKPLVATIDAVAAGTTTVSTQSDQACLHAALPCLPPQLGWSVTVTVR